MRKLIDRFIRWYLTRYGAETKPTKNRRMQMNMKVKVTNAKHGTSVNVRVPKTDVVDDNCAVCYEITVTQARTIRLALCRDKECHCREHNSHQVIKNMEGPFNNYYLLPADSMMRPTGEVFV